MTFQDVTQKMFTAIRGTGLSRGPDRWLGGVCGGIAAKLGVDPNAARIVFLVLALVPDSITGRIYLESWLSNDSVT